MPGPLSGIKVIEVTTFLAGPLAAQMLGEHGADVIKIETPPHGDTMRAVGPARNRGMPSQYLTYNRNKRSVALDLKRPEGLAALIKLVEGADVFLHNMRPPAAARLGIDYDSLVKHNPRLVYASAPGFRQDGPYKDRPAFDDLIQGMSGIAGMFLRRDGKPAYVPFNLADKVIAYCLVSGIGMALLHRERTGEGQEVQVPMLETMLEFNSVDQMYGCVFEPELPPGFGHPRALSPGRRPFPTRDGYICLQTTTNDQFSRLFTAIERPGMIEDERFATVEARTRNMDEMLPLIAEALQQRTTGEWLEILEDADIPNAPMLALEELAANPYIAETGFFQSFDHPTEGRLRRASPGVVYTKSPQDMQRHAPSYGEHTDEVLGELGLSSADIGRASGRTPAK